MPSRSMPRPAPAPLARWDWPWGEVNILPIAPKRRNVGNPWFKRGTLARAVIDALRRSAVPMTTREIIGRAVSREEARGHAPSSYGAASGNFGGAAGA
jgi:hypothetical protein